MAREYATSWGAITPPQEKDFSQSHNFSVTFWVF
jgi:hypothetical protein